MTHTDTKIAVALIDAPLGVGIRKMFHYMRHSMILNLTGILAKISTILAKR